MTIQYLNFKVTVLGEVKAPGSYKVNSERVSIFDALGMAGDLQINAKRKNVLVMREDGDEKVFAQLDLTSENIIHSPFFYLQQNDVVYVEPNKARIVGRKCRGIPALRFIEYFHVSGYPCHRNSLT